MGRLSHKLSEGLTKRSSQYVTIVQSWSYHPAILILWKKPRSLTAITKWISWKSQCILTRGRVMTYEYSKRCRRFEITIDTAWNLCLGISHVSERVLGHGSFYETLFTKYSLCCLSPSLLLDTWPSSSDSELEMKFILHDAYHSADDPAINKISSIATKCLQLSWIIYHCRAGSLSLWVAILIHWQPSRPSMRGFKRHSGLKRGVLYS